MSDEPTCGNERRWADIDRVTTCVRPKGHAKAHTDRAFEDPKLIDMIWWDREPAAVVPIATEKGATNE